MLNIFICGKCNAANKTRNDFSSKIIPDSVHARELLY